MISDEVVDIQFYERQFWEDRALEEPPYRWLDDEHHALRYAPMERRRWQSVLPRDVETLWLDGRAIRLAAQVRIEPREIEVEDDASEALFANPFLGMGRSIFPADIHHRQEVLEHVPLSRRMMPLDPVGAVAEVHPEVPVRLDLLGGRVPLHHRVDVNSLGEMLELMIDERASGPSIITSRLGSFSLGATAAGSHRLELLGPPGRYFINGFAHDASVPLYKRYKVYELKRGQPIHITLDTAGQARYLNAVVYTAGDNPNARVVIESTLDGGRSRATAGRLLSRVSNGVLTHELPPIPGQPTLFLDKVTGDASPPRAFGHLLAEDLQPGAHTVRFNLVEGPSPLWVRFFVLDEITLREHGAQVRREVAQ